MHSEAEARIWCFRFIFRLQYFQFSLVDVLAYTVTLFRNSIIEFPPSFNSLLFEQQKWSGRPYSSTYSLSLFLFRSLFFHILLRSVSYSLSLSLWYVYVHSVCLFTSLPSDKCHRFLLWLLSEPLIWCFLCSARLYVWSGSMSTDELNCDNSLISLLFISVICIIWCVFIHYSEYWLLSGRHYLMMVYPSTTHSKKPVGFFRPLAIMCYIHVHTHILVSVYIISE